MVTSDIFIELTRWKPGTAGNRIVTARLLRKHFLSGFARRTKHDSHQLSILLMLYHIWGKTSSQWNAYNLFLWYRYLHYSHLQNWIAFYVFDFLCDELWIIIMWMMIVNGSCWWALALVNEIGCSMVVQMPESAIELVEPDAKLLPQLAAMRLTGNQTTSEPKIEPDIHHLNNKVSYRLYKMWFV